LPHDRVCEEDVDTDGGAYLHGVREDLTTIGLNKPCPPRYTRLCAAEGPESY
jgi:hypothetical protein